MDHKVNKTMRLKTLGALLITLSLLFGGCVTYDEAGTSKVAEPGEVLKKITEVRFTEDSEAVSIWITGNQVLTYTSVKQPFPSGVILYFPIQPWRVSSPAWPWTVTSLNLSGPRN